MATAATTDNEYFLLPSIQIPIYFLQKYVINLQNYN
jgi:hypothetical protein